MSKHSEKKPGGGNTPPAPLAPGDVVDVPGEGDLLVTEVHEDGSATAEPAAAPPPVLFLCRDQKPLRLTARHKKGTISATFRPKGRRLLLPHAAASTFAGALGALVKAGRLLRVHAKEEA